MSTPMETSRSAAATARGKGATRPIDRAALVRRHNPTLHAVDCDSPFGVGNGDFAFGADITGLQTFGEHYRRIPLCTLSSWGWHRSPRPAGWVGATLRLKPYATGDRQVGYPTDARGQEPLFAWLRENPHRLHLGALGLALPPVSGREARPDDLESIEQVLDLWSGRLTSQFRLGGAPVSVWICCHPERDLLAVRVESPLLRSGELGLRLAFPYGSPAMAAADWDAPERHTTECTQASATAAAFARRLDQDGYHVAVAWSKGGRLQEAGPHTWLIAAPGCDRLELRLAFAPDPITEPLPEVAAVEAAAARHWAAFWTSGGAVELAGSRDARAPELERRIVLSQFLTAVHCSGAMPPQESGLVCNSWYGKFHLEMHWWHAAHFAFWGRTHLLERSLAWYERILGAARRTAAEQGYAGARWPKMTGPDGRESPSGIGPLLIWQQPHPIAYADLCYRQRPTRATLERFREIVFASADFMASFARFDAASGRYVLGPPVIPAQENHRPEETLNPAFELAYWRYGLQIAQRWRERLGLGPDPHWAEVLARLAPLPRRAGLYLAHENCPQTFSERNYDHPSMLGALGVLPGEGVDASVMRRTLERVLADWRWERTWGWDYPLTAMCAARLGRPDWAIAALLMETPKNRYLPNGHNYQRENLPVYLPGNGGLLAAVALMAGGAAGGGAGRAAGSGAEVGAAGDAPGFPRDGQWLVRSEGLRPLGGYLHTSG